MSNPDVIVVAIDGPSASGKSTVSRRVAERLGYTYVDSGSMYRAVTWKALREGIDPLDKERLLAMLVMMKLEIRVVNRVMTLSIDGVEPGMELRAEAVVERVSDIAAVPEVRAYIVGKLRSMASFGNIVMEGRDIGSVVFMDTRFKFYLDADPEERARRRHKEMSSGDDADVGAVYDSLRRRDEKDTSRKTAPLQIALGARVIDTTSMDIDKVAEEIVRQVEEGN